MLKYVFIVLLIACSSVHLFRSWQDNTKKRPLTKWMPLLCIIGYFLSSVGTMDRLAVILLIALITSWIGDVLLIPHGMKWFVAGGISFMLAHFSLITLYAMQINYSAVKWAVVIPVAVIYFGWAVWEIKTLSPYAKKVMKIPLFVYLCANAVMNVFALILLTAQPCAATAVAYIGAILFFVSDCTLFFVRLHENKQLIFKKHFTVMLTYILGEFLITAGMTMMIQ